MPAQAHEDADHFTWQMFLSVLRRAQLTLLVALSALTVGAWTLTLYYALDMSAPVDVVLADDGMAGMAMAGYACWRLVVCCGYDFRGALDGNDGGDDASCRCANDSNFRVGPNAARW